MSIQYIVQADVVDINTDKPKADDVFLVDTNVWYWMAYPTASQNAHHYQLNTYPGYVGDALTLGSQIYQSGLSMAELAHRIEVTEYDIYASYVQKIGLKEYRHNIQPERSRVVSEVETAWALVKSMADPLEVVLDGHVTDSALKRLKTETVDGYDLFILETMKKNGVVQIITDDGDFTTVPGIIVFTANRNVLNAAQQQNKLLTR